MLENNLSLTIQLIDKTIAISFFYDPLDGKFILGFQFNLLSGTLTAESNPSILNQLFFAEKIKDHNYNELKENIEKMMKNSSFRNRVKELTLHKYCVELSYQDFYQQYIDFKDK